MKKILCFLLTAFMINFPLVNGASEGTDIKVEPIDNSSNDNLENFCFENYETNILDEIIGDIKGTSEMSFTEQAFLNGMIRKYKPKKILELGVSAGGSSAIILNACKDIPDSKLYSIDKLSYYYKNPEKSVGYIVGEKFSNLMDKWKLYKGDIPCSFIDDIGSGIDFVLIDTVHVRPGEIADFLTVLPYLKENAIVCFHDIGIAFNCFEWGDNIWTEKVCYYSNDTLFSCIKGDKILPKTQYNEFFSNIGAIRLDKEQKKCLLDYFFLFSLPWEYIPEKSDSEKLIKHFEKHYGSELVDYYKKGLSANIKYHDRVRIKSGIAKLG